MTGDLDRQASDVDANGGRRRQYAKRPCGTLQRRRQSAKRPCSTLRQRRRLRLAFLLFFRSSNRFLRFPSDLQNLDMEIVSDTLYLLMLLSCIDFKMVHGCAKLPCGTLRRRRRLRLAFLIFFRFSNRFLRFPSDLQNLDMEIVSDTLYLLMLLSCMDFKMVHGCACNVRGISERRPIFQFFGSVFTWPPTTIKRG